MHVHTTFAAALALVLTSCETAPTPVAPPAPAAPAPTAATDDPLAALGPGVLTPDDAAKLFGPADVDRRDGAGAMLAYRLEGCALLLLFAQDESGALRLSEARSGERRVGVAPLPLRECVAAARARAGTPS
jgi:hypothetical protein